MLNREKLNRLNELAKKKKESTLTAEECLEQQALRSEYLSNFRSCFKQMLDNTYIQNEEGNKTPLKKKPPQ
ncbi:MAG: DUF896 domain-containing protein [Christensenellales bacterium]